MAGFVFSVFRSVHQGQPGVGLHIGPVSYTHLCSSIVGIQPGYAARSALTGVTLLTPVWQVSTDTVVYQLDLVSGAVTRLSE